MKPAEYLDAAKTALALSSDYALAKVMNITTDRLSKLRRQERPMDEAEMIFLATTLEIDPGLIVADLGEQRTKNKGKKELLRGFLSRAAVLAAVCVTLALTCSGGAGSAPGAAGGRRRLRFA